MRQNVISQVVFTSDRETTAFNEAIRTNTIMRNGDVTPKVVGGEETFLTKMAHVISLAKMDFLRMKKIELSMEA